MFNTLKEKTVIPEFMQKVLVATIYKNKGDKLDLSNDRGIFLVNKLRGILMKLIHKDKFEAVDSYMSDSNIGGRNAKGVRNHLFVINSISFDVHNTKNRKPVNLLIYDYRQMFDSMDLRDSLNDTQCIMAGLMEGPLKSQHFALYRCVPGLCSCAESTANCHHNPALTATPRSDVRAFTPLLP